jgi:hypothetical protein
MCGSHKGGKIYFGLTVSEVSVCGHLAVPSGPVGGGAEDHGREQVVDQNGLPHGGQEVERQTGKGQIYPSKPHLQ